MGLENMLRRRRGLVTGMGDEVIFCCAEKGGMSAQKSRDRGNRPEAHGAYLDNVVKMRYDDKNLRASVKTMDGGLWAMRKAWKGGEKSMRRNAVLRLVPVMLSFACLFGCGSGEPGIHTETGREEAASDQGEESTASRAQAGGSSQVQQVVDSTPAQEDFEPYQAPEFADSVFHAELAEGTGSVLLDLSNAESGYGGISVKADSRVKMRITTEGENDAKYDYEIPADGTPVFFPLTGGDGYYTFFIGENVEGTKYAKLYATEVEVKLKDEFQPFIRPSMYVNYSQDSACVRKAAELAQTAETALDVVDAVYEYVCDNITYDKDLAVKVQEKTVTNYVPDLDQVLAAKKGICFDYAALAAAMLRSQGIPTKMVFGDVSPNNVYHAWNMFYTEQTGWVSVHFEVKTNEWNRLDLTFSANGADGNFIGDGSNYLDMYYY